MAAVRSSVYTLFALAYLGCQPAGEQPLTPAETAAIAETVADRFEEIATATNNLQFDRLLALYGEGDDLTYVARGRVTRSYTAFAELLRAQFSGVTAAKLSFWDRHVDVLSREVVVITAPYEFSASSSAGRIGGSSGTFTCVYVLRDGEWKIQHSSHTFHDTC